MKSLHECTRSSGCGSMVPLHLVLMVWAAILVGGLIDPASASSSSTSHEDQHNRSVAVFGYLPEYRLDGFPYEEFFRHGLTHLIFFSLEIASRPGAAAALAKTERLPSGEAWSSIRAMAHRYGVQLLASIGGGGRSEGFSHMICNRTSRREVMRELRSFMADKSLDGVDLNWEYPQTQDEWRCLGAWLSELRSGLSYHPRRADTPTKRPILTMALHPHPQILPIMQSHRLLPWLDFVHWMAYDAPSESDDGHHSSLAFAMEVLSGNYVEALLKPRRPTATPPPPGDRPSDAKRRPHRAKLASETNTDGRLRGDVAKLTLGIPFYGRRVRDGQAETYSALQHRDVDGEHSNVATLDQRRRRHSVDGFLFSSYAEVQQKMRLARARGLGGIMLWELGQDLVPASTQPLSLMRAICAELRAWSGEENGLADPLYAPTAEMSSTWMLANQQRELNEVCGDDEVVRESHDDTDL